MTIQEIKRQVRQVRNKIEDRTHKVEGKIVRIESGFDKAGASECMAMESYVDELRCESNGLRFALRQLDELLDRWWELP